MRLASMLFAMALLVVSSFSVSAPANAQSVGGGKVLIPCSAFSGTVFVCVNNMSSYPITWIDCDGYHADVIAMSPFIAPHDYGAVKFPKNFCRVVIVHTASTFHVQGNFDAKGNTVLPIIGW